MFFYHDEDFPTTSIVFILNNVFYPPILNLTFLHFYNFIKTLFSMIVKLMKLISAFTVFAKTFGFHNVVGM